MKEPNAKTTIVFAELLSYLNKQSSAKVNIFSEIIKGNIFFALFNEVFDVFCYFISEINVLFRIIPYFCRGKNDIILSFYLYHPADIEGKKKVDICLFGRQV